jgi:hypothetical protein
VCAAAHSEHWGRQAITTVSDNLDFRSRVDAARSPLQRNTARRTLLPVVDVRGDKNRRCRAVVFDPMRSRAKFRECLTGSKLHGGPVVVMVGKRAAENVDDRRVALVTVKADMAARRHCRAADPQLAAIDEVYLLSQIDRREDFFLDPSIILGALCCPNAKPAANRASPTDDSTKIRGAAFISILATISKRAAA